jgi:hypothetical protein
MEHKLSYLHVRAHCSSTIEAVEGYQLFKAPIRGAVFIRRCSFVV